MTSPVSVTHEVVRARRTPCRPGTPASAVPPPRAPPRAGRPRSTTGALRSVAGSKTDHSWRAPGDEPAARQPARQVQRRARAAPPARAPRCGCRRRRDASSVEATARRRAPHLDGPVPGSSENSNDAQREAAVDAGRGARSRRGRRAEQRHLQPAVLLQLEPVVGRHRLADGEADLLAAVVDAAPRRAPTRSARGRWPGCGGRLEVGPVDEEPPWRRPRPAARESRGAA